jgi:hypothetical protein
MNLVCIYLTGREEYSNFQRCMDCELLFICQFGKSFHLKVFSKTEFDKEDIKEALTYMRVRSYIEALMNHGYYKTQKVSQ